LPTNLDHRPDPDQLLRQIQATESQLRLGTLKVFLGYASGVGKSYRMLNEGRRRKQRGEDVVIGVLQDKPDPAVDELLGDFEIIPSLRINGREVMDVQAIVARKPRVCVVDELAYDNPPQSRHAKRYEDIQELREAGICVITAVNLQHIDELKPKVGPLAGKIVTDTIPKSFLLAADEIEIVDIPPEQLLERVGQQPDEEAQAAERRRLSELREIALLLAAEVVDRQLETYFETHGLYQTIATQERILICITPRADARAMIITGKRTAYRFHGELVVLYVQQRGLSQADQDALKAQFTFARESGARVEVLNDEDPIETILRFAAENRITQIFIGRSLRENWWTRLFGSPVDRLIRHAEGMDVCVFPH
jgi:two-component system sensor histidine kinase KdpD